MRNLIIFGITFCGMVLIYACAANKTEVPTPVSCTTVNIDSNTYNLAVKPILDFYCAYEDCHDNITAESNVNLSAYTSAVAAFEQKDALCTIKWEGECLTMPEGGNKLADSLITVIQCWAENGYQE